MIIFRLVYKNILILRN